LTTPTGGEHFTVGTTIRIQWSASDDKGLTSQKVEFSPDGISFSPIATLDGNARSFDWKVPGWPTTTARIRVTVLDGVNLPVSSVGASPFEIVNGPPDTTPPAVTLLSHNTFDPVGAGLASSIKWRETDNVGVLRRVIEISLNTATTMRDHLQHGAQQWESQIYQWQVPAAMMSSKAKVRITVYDGAGNSATVSSNKNFVIWPMPIINGATFTEADKPSIEIAGRNFRPSETEIWVADVPLKKLKYEDRYFTGNGMFKRVTSLDKKLTKRIPDRTWVKFEIRVPRTGQVSPAFDFKRKKPLS
jgi:hypothetical protein